MQKLAAVHDLAGCGRTSLNVVIPLLTALGVQVVPLPTAILSSGTNGYENFYFTDLTQSMRGVLDHWKHLHLEFDSVYSGFLGSPEQVQLVSECADTCMKQGGLFVVDPVLGDNGELEPTMDLEMVSQMRWLCSKAKCITPNITEAALLLDEKMLHLETTMDVALLKEWLLRLADMGPDFVVITSVPEHDNRFTSVVAYDRKQRAFWKVSSELIPAMYPGTGDCFTSILTGALLKGNPLPMAIDKAVQFVSLGITKAFARGTREREGIALEELVQNLCLATYDKSYSVL